MSKQDNPLFDPKNRSAETALVHGGIERSQFNETSEAIYMTSGYTYPESAYAEKLFKGEIVGRFSSAHPEHWVREFIAEHTDIE